MGVAYGVWAGLKVTWDGLGSYERLGLCGWGFVGGANWNECWLVGGAYGQVGGDRPRVGGASCHVGVFYGHVRRAGIL